MNVCLKYKRTNVCVHAFMAAHIVYSDVCKYSVISRL